MDNIKVGVLTASDRASKGIYSDQSGKNIKDLLKIYIKNDIEFFYDVIADNRKDIENSMLKMVDKTCDLIITTGGTGPAPRDVTVEATLNVIEKELRGFGELMRSVSLEYVPTAILSRQTAGTIGSTLIVNLPGSPKSIKECLDVIFPAIPYCIDLIGGNYIVGNKDAVEVFRPKKR